MKKLIIILILLAIAAPARAEIGKTVKDFIKSPFYHEIELSFYYRSVQTKPEGKCIVQYFLSKKSNSYYLVELIRKEDEEEEKIISQSMQFPDNPAKWDVFTVSGFVDETIGQETKSGDLLVQMFKEISLKIKNEEPGYSEKNLAGHKIKIKLISAGDWKVTITEL